MGEGEPTAHSHGRGHLHLKPNTGKVNKGSHVRVLVWSHEPPSDTEMVYVYSRMASVCQQRTPRGQRAAGILLGARVSESPRLDVAAL